MRPDEINPELDYEFGFYDYDKLFPELNRGLHFIIIGTDQGGRIVFLRRFKKLWKTSTK